MTDIYDQKKQALEFLRKKENLKGCTSYVQRMLPVRLQSSREHLGDAGSGRPYHTGGPRGQPPLGGASTRTGWQMTIVCSRCDGPHMRSECPLEPKTVGIAPAQPSTSPGASALAEELREYTAMKYAGDCKCGKCQLVPRALVERIYHTLNGAGVAATALIASNDQRGNDLVTVIAQRDAAEAALRALLPAATLPGPDKQLDRIFIGSGEYVRADEAVKTISALKEQLRASAATPIDRDQLAKALAVAFHGDTCVSHGFRSKADTVLAFLGLAPAATPGRDQYEFPYQRTFDAICAAVDTLRGSGGSYSVSVKSFQDKFNNHRDAEASPLKAIDTLVSRPNQPGGE